MGFLNFALNEVKGLRDRCHGKLPAPQLLVKHMWEKIRKIREKSGNVIYQKSGNTDKISFKMLVLVLQQISWGIRIIGHFSKNAIHWLPISIWIYITLRR